MVKQNSKHELIHDLAIAIPNIRFAKKINIFNYEDIELLQMTEFNSISYVCGTQVFDLLEYYEWHAFTNMNTPIPKWFNEKYELKKRFDEICRAKYYDEGAFVGMKHFNKEEYIAFVNSLFEEF